ncbi:MAG: transporter [Flavobacteriaceae bacterium]|nr:transporter [Flavobacteriaceae bacterium]
MKYSCFLVLILISATTFSQQIITDRPDQTESSSTIPKNSFQIEMGMQQSNNNSLTSFAGPSTLLRYGISDKIELRLFNQYESHKIELDGGNIKFDGLGDIEVGFKVQLFKKEDVNTEIAFLSHAIIPTAKEALTNDKVGSINKLSISHSLSEKISLGYNIGYDYAAQTNVFTYSVVLGFSLSDKIGAYIEPFGALAEGGQYEGNFDVGLTYLAKDNLQFDVAYGAGLNNDMQYVSAGFSWNIPQFLIKK